MEKITSHSQLNEIKDAQQSIIKNSKCRILICAGTGCLAGGSGKIYERMLDKSAPTDSDPKVSK